MSFPSLLSSFPTHHPTHFPHSNSTFSNPSCLNLTDVVQQPIQAACIAIGIVFMIYHIRNSQQVALEKSKKKKVMEESRKNALIFPLYYTFIKVYALILLLRAVLVFLTDFTAVFSIGEVFVSGPVGTTLLDSVAYFLTQKSSGENSIRRTKYFAIIHFIVNMVTGIFCFCFLGRGLFKTNSDVSADNVLSMYWMVSDCFSFSIALVCIFYMFLKNVTRKANYYYSSFAIFIYGLSILFEVESNNIPFSPCLQFFVDCFNDLFWPFVLFFSLQYDSQYWNDIIAPNHDVLDQKSMLNVTANGSPSINQGVLLRTQFFDASAPLLAPDVMYASGPTGAVPFPAEFVVPFDSLRFGRQIGSGGTSVVYRGNYKGQNVAIKSFRCEMLTKEYIEKFAQEMSMSVRLYHPNIVKCLGICIVPPSICIITEYMERGSLFRVLSLDAQFLTYVQRLSFALDAASGVAFLHSLEPKIIHRDIKSLNFLVDSKYKIKLADLGEAREIQEDEHMTVNRGTPHWMSPEAFIGSEYDEKTDVYSLAIVMWEIMTSKRPFEDLNAYLIPAAVVEKQQRPAFPSWMPPEYGELVTKCWSQDPKLRPHASEVVRQLKFLVNDAPIDGSWPKNK